MPDHRAALAASDGVVWSAAKTPRGWSVVIDHEPRKLATYYTHLASVLVTAKQTVSAGTPIGIIDADPLDDQHIKHLHFEIWHGRASDRFDPQWIIETTLEYLPDPGDLPRPLVARNAGHRARDRGGFTVPSSSTIENRHGGSRVRPVSTAAGSRGRRRRLPLRLRADRDRGQIGTGRSEDDNTLEFAIGRGYIVDDETETT
jgi:murein DD-endopeptidase MepM/ murein hydrolase activator NlpD